MKADVLKVGHRLFVCSELSSREWLQIVERVNITVLLLGQGTNPDLGENPKILVQGKDFGNPMFAHEHGVVKVV